MNGFIFLYLDIGEDGCESLSEIEMCFIKYIMPISNIHFGSVLLDKMWTFECCKTEYIWRMICMSAIHRNDCVSIEKKTPHKTFEKHTTVSKVHTRRGASLLTHITKLTHD